MVMTRLQVSSDERLTTAVDRLLAGGERLVLERNGVDVAALVSLEELRELERAVEMIEDQLDATAAKEALEEMAETGQRPIPFAQVRQELGLDSTS